jgi:hypothetical protein
VDNFKKDLTCRIIPDTVLNNQYRRNKWKKINKNTLTTIVTRW